MNEDQQPPFIPAWMRKQHWTPHQWAIYCYVASWGECFVGLQAIAQELHMTKPVLKRELDELVRLGWITRERDKKRRSHTLKATSTGKPMFRIGRPKTAIKWEHRGLAKPGCAQERTPPKDGNPTENAKNNEVYLNPRQYQLKEEEDWRTKRDNEPEHLKKVEALKGVYWQRYEEAIKAGDWQMARMWLAKARRGGINNEVTDD